jgi:hypothetical protein
MRPRSCSGSDKQKVSKPEARRRKLLLQRYFQTPGHDFGDPFSSHYSYFEPASSRVDPLRHFFMRHLPSSLTFSPEGKEERAKEYQDGELPKEISVFVDRLARVLIALTGGAFLIVPMVIMVLNQGHNQVQNLVTASTAVVLFALAMAFGVRVSNAETLIATATYAAVLVVFVCTSTSSPGPTA